MKDIKQLVPDLQKAIAQGSKYAAEEMSFQLRDQGPYWTGTFYESIRISNGANGPARTVSPPVANESGGFEREERPSTEKVKANNHQTHPTCLLYTSPSPRDRTRSRMPSSA